MTLELEWTEYRDVPTGEEFRDTFFGPGVACRITERTPIHWQGVLTDEHPACSYGQAVLLVDGQAHGPLDRVGGPDGDEAGAIVNSERMRNGMETSDVAKMALAFVLQGLLLRDAATV